MTKWNGDLGKVLCQPLPPEIQAAEDARIADLVASLPGFEGTFSGRLHLITDACYGLGGCGPDCPVWVGEAEDARGPN